ncbi:MAG: exodeoxyribonuclease VII large subunit [Candidatus Limnocylindrus sp.]
MTQPVPEEALSVSEVAARIRAQIGDDPALASCAVVGEVQSSMRSTAGHEYLTLRDAESTLDAVRFRGSIRPGEELPAVGEMVILLGRIDLYTPRSRYQLIANALIRPGGMGRLSQELEALRRKLQVEGLFDAARKRPIPVAPRGIAIVTSRSGAVLHDVVRVLRSSAPQTRLLLVHAPVQGATAPKELADAIRRANVQAAREARAGNITAPSVILLARGGGSSDDLSAFNSEVLLRAIAASDLPVLSAVGHESDVTLADLVADDRAGTPSIAAARLSPNLDLIRARPLQLLARAYHEVQRRLMEHASEVREAGRSLRAAGPDSQVEREEERLALTGDDLVRAARLSLRVATQRVRQTQLLLTALSPLAILARGYAMVQGADGTLVRSWRQAPAGREILVRLAEGSLVASVKRSEKGGRDGGKAS